MKDYHSRIADRLLRKQLDAVGAVLIQGPKWCGKTTTAEQVAQSCLYMNNPDTMDNNLALAGMTVRKLLEGDTPRLIDEWQLAPRLWDAIRFEVDHREEHRGQFILTGSAVPADMSEVHHSGVGRFAWLTMRTMSLWESGDSTGEVSLKQLFDGGEPEAGDRRMDIDTLAYLVCRGGWPEVLTASPETALLLASNYVDAVVESDISRVDGVSRDARIARRIMRSLARVQGGQVALAEIRNDIVANGTLNVSDATIATYVKSLAKIFVVDDMPAWNPNLRSKTAIRTSDTRYFTDSSIAVASLGIGPSDLIADLRTFGLLFETLAMRDLRVYADALGGDVYHFRDKNGMECDAVIHLRNGHYGLVEIKLGGDKLIDEGAAALNKLEGKIDLTKMYEPSFKMVLTGIGQYAYRRVDGVLVVPIGCLKD